MSAAALATARSARRDLHNLAIFLIIKYSTQLFRTAMAVR